MRLLNAKTLKFEEHLGKTPPYAILSHTWEAEEISFQDFCYVHGDDAIKPGLWSLYRRDGKARRIMAKPGYRKILDFAKTILEHPNYGMIEHIWTDTCCIDKQSSSELQEAINSMYTWYRWAKACFVYLCDVPPGQDPKQTSSAFRSARWFRRGWTLQELLAPKAITFFDQTWGEIATKQDLYSVIEEVTMIEKAFLQGKPLAHASVARKMSWAASRETSRIEDMAYCLLGIFGINIPLIYGEGSRAFQRLQEEILRVSDDPSLLIWGYTGTLLPDPETQWSSPLSFPVSPKYFRLCGDVDQDIINDTSTSETVNRVSFQVIQRGLQLFLPIKADPFNMGLIYGIVQSGRRLFAIPFICVNSAEEEEYIRAQWLIPQRVSPKFLEGSVPRSIVVLKGHMASFRLRKTVGSALQFRIPLGYCLAGVYPPHMIRFSRSPEEPCVAESYNPARYRSDPNCKQSKYFNMFHLVKNDESFLVIYEYKIKWRKDGRSMIYESPSPFQCFSFQEERFDLEYALSLIQDTSLQSMLVKAKLTNEQGDTISFPPLSHHFAKRIIEDRFV